MSLRLPFALALVCAFTCLYTSNGMDTRRYKEAMEIALKPRTAGEDLESIKKAIIEVIHAHYYETMGRDYPIGSITGLFAGKRRKRFSNFGSNWNSFGSSGGWGSSGIRSDPWSDPWRDGNKYGGGGGGGGGGGYNDHRGGGNDRYGGGSGGGGPHYNDNNNYNSGYNSFGNSGFRDNSRLPEILHCPVQANQSYIFQLNSSGDAYPASDIGNELYSRSLPGSDLFFFCLIKSAILPDTPPALSNDPNFVTANMTCPSDDQILFSYVYQNTAYGGRCWIIQGFQELVRFSVCLTKSCINCKLEGHERAGGYKQWNSNKNQPNNYSQNSRNMTVNQCVTEYRTVQVLSYCEKLPSHSRIVYDRIIVPLFCTCKSVDCIRQAQQQHY